MEQQNTAAEKLVEQILENISDEQSRLMNQSEASTEYIRGKDIGMAEAKHQTRKAFEQVTGQEFEQ